MSQGKKLSKVSLMHYIKLVMRSLFLVAAVFIFIYHKTVNADVKFTAIYAVVGVILGIEMIMRFFPSGHESMGCQKQFKKNYKEKSSEKIPRSLAWQRTLAIGIAWVVLNGIFGTLYLTNIFDKDIMFIISMAYSVSDMICILFFCPFQSWFMKNRCCTTCRIYNWDFAMMFTPFVFIKGVYTWGLFGIAFLLFLNWEIDYKIHPERFNEYKNGCLSCAECPEKLCEHKKQLKKFIRTTYKEDNKKVKAGK